MSISQDLQGTAAFIDGWCLHKKTSPTAPPACWPRSCSPSPTR